MIYCISEKVFLKYLEPGNDDDGQRNDKTETLVLTARFLQHQKPSRHVILKDESPRKFQPKNMKVFQLKPIFNPVIRHSFAPNSIARFKCSDFTLPHMSKTVKEYQSD